MYDPARPGDELAAAQLLDVTNEAELESFLGRLVNMGDLSISTAASQDAVEFVEGVPDPAHIRDLIVVQRQTA